MKKITQSLMALSLVVPSTALILSAEKVDAQVQKEVTSDSLNVRTGPGAKHKIVDWLKKGQIVNVLNDGRDWDYIQFSNGKKGYVYDEYLKTISIGEEVKSVNAYWLTMRNGPGSTYKAIDYLKKGTKVKVLSISGQWSKVSVNNKTGYVHTSYLSKAQTTVTQNSNPSASSLETKTVTAYWLTMRTGPSTNYKDIDYLKKGTALTVHSYKGDWAYVSVNGKKGYVNSNYLSTQKQATTPATKPVVKPAAPQTNQIATKTLYVNAPDGLNLRTGRGINYKAIKSIPYRAAVKVSNVSGNWGYVEYAGFKGYANVGYLVASQPVISKPNVSNPSETNGSTSLKGKVIVLDPGHGGKFAGAHSFAIEEDVNLSIALKTKQKLQQMGAQVVMTRTTDTSCSLGTYSSDLLCRPALAEKMKANAFISIHANAGSSAAHGAEAYYYNSSRGDKKLATNILNEMIDETGVRNRGVDYGNFSVIRNSTVPSTLIETGFVTNKSDAAKLNSSSYQEKYAKAISEGIEEFF
ncbi:N-acetylmuramoyl-L-alanine amidase [[Brevibacterium] frigoritolerans]|nr:N-acetylmuramoyl-L-alanine amidase [Peribacillus frigoritolerans]